MSVAKITFYFLLVTLLAVGVSTTAFAFHEGGVGECAGCHSMHSPAAGGTRLLVGTDPSSACLTCHEHAGDTGPFSYHISTNLADMPAGTAPLQRTPGGDFGWLKKSYTFLLDGITTTDDGANMGHDIKAIDFGYTGRSNNPTTAPGGTFSTANLGCNSCHDAHGRTRRLATGTLATTGAPIKGSGSYTDAANEPDATGAVGLYRLLAGPGYTQGGVTFDGAPAAKVQSSYNRSEDTTSTRVAYGAMTTTGHQTWGDWCATCHPGMHSASAYVHPVDASFGNGTDTNYNQYVKSGDMTGGAGATAYTSLVPFAIATTAYTDLVTAAGSTAGAGSTSRVMCLSCHRAHASGFLYMLRWEQEYEFITKVVSGVTSYGGTDVAPTDNALSRGRTNAEKQASYYDRPAVTYFATYQRVLCNKCHAKD